jgi:hypothetical protein
MVRMILAVVVGFIAWSILWVGTDMLLGSISPEWYGAHQAGLATAMTNTMPFAVDSTILMIGIVRSLIISLIAGFLTAYIAGENIRPTLLLGILLLIVGILVQAMQWNYIPLWYHVIFLILLVPMTVFGGMLRGVLFGQAPPPAPDLPMDGE